MHVPKRVLLIVSIGMVVAGCDQAESENREPQLTFDGEALQVDSVKCLSALGRINVVFDGGTLIVTPMEGEPGFRSLLEFDDQQGRLTNRTLDGSETGGLDVDLAKGVEGEVMLMRDSHVMDPERFPDAEASQLQVRLFCPED